MRTIEIDSTAMRYIELQGLRPNINSPYPNNAIISSRYTKYNFIPKSLIRQFLSLPKIWFLIISILEIGSNNSTCMNYSTAVPLAILVFLGMAREGYDDYTRHISDAKTNSQIQKVWNGTKFVAKECKDILVGDIILLENNEVAPADIVILSVGNEEHECYADVSAVMGESNLKLKHPIKDIQNKIDSLDIKQASASLSILNDELIVNIPNKSFKSFNGKVKMPISPKASNLDIDYLLLRGMRITNTPWLFGSAVYTGIETKVWINNLTKPTKTPKLKKIMDKWILWMLLIAITISIVNTIIFEAISIPGYQWYDIFIGNLILFNHFVQISLYLSIELVKNILSILDFIKKPDYNLNTKYMLSDLGMVEYIVTDKTGTLTENCLDVVLFVINDKLYFKDEKDLYESDLSDRNSSISKLNPRKTSMDYTGEVHSFKEIYGDFESGKDYQKFLDFFLCLALCNLAFPVDDDFVAISVDDKVLAKKAACFGVKLVSRDTESCIINIQGTEVLYQILGSQIFSSDTKKSRIIVKNADSSEVLMFVKGSRDSMVPAYNHSSYTRQDCEDAIVRYRTLFLGIKRMKEKEAEDFLFEYETSQMSPVNKQGRIENVFKRYERGLDYLGIVGLEDSVAEDTKDAVECLKKAGIKFWVLSGDSEESTLTSSISAGIFKTEDKIIRLVNFSSELDCMNILQSTVKNNIYPDSLVERLSIEEGSTKNLPMIKSEIQIPQAASVASIVSVEDAMNLPRKKVRRSTLFVREDTRRSTVHPLVSKISLFHRKTSLKGEYNPKNLKFILSIDSIGLEYGTSSKEHLRYFTTLLFAARAICFHSLLPDQKTKVVKLIKYNFRFRPLVMSVGDGISDVGMIQQADVGVGIEGREGSEAASNADVSIKKFSQLKDLIMIFGHRQYIKVSKMILISFYIMMLLEVLLYIYNPISAWTAQSIMQKEFLIVYILAISIFPIVSIGIFDKDETAEGVVYKAYKVGIFNCLLTPKYLLIYLGSGVLQGGFTFLCTQFFFSHSIGQGNTEDSILIGSSIFLIISTTVLMNVLVETYSISLKVIIYYIFCISLEVIAVIPLTATNTDLYGYTSAILDYQTIWFYLIFTTLFNFIICYFFKAIRYLFFPNFLEKILNSSPNSSFGIDSRLGQFKKSLKNVYK